MSAQFLNLLEILAYLAVGTVGIAWLGGFVLKRMQPSKNQPASRKNPFKDISPRIR